MGFSLVSNESNMNLNVFNLSRTNCETFCNMMLFNLPHSTQASHTTGCIRGDLRWDFKQYFWTNDLKYLEWIAGLFNCIQTVLRCCREDQSLEEQLVERLSES